jgi:hypothetical protein
MDRAQILYWMLAILELNCSFTDSMIEPGKCLKGLKCQLCNFVIGIVQKNLPHSSNINCPQAESLTVSSQTLAYPTSNKFLMEGVRNSYAEADVNDFHCP